MSTMNEMHDEVRKAISEQRFHNAFEIFNKWIDIEIAELERKRLLLYPTPSDEVRAAVERGKSFSISSLLPTPEKLYGLFYSSPFDERGIDDVLFTNKERAQKEADRINEAKGKHNPYVCEVVEFITINREEP